MTSRISDNPTELGTPPGLGGLTLAVAAGRGEAPPPLASAAADLSEAPRVRRSHVSAQPARGLFPPLGCLPPHVLPVRALARQPRLVPRAPAGSHVTASARSPPPPRRLWLPAGPQVPGAGPDLVGSRSALKESLRPSLRLWPTGRRRPPKGPVAAREVQLRLERSPLTSLVKCPASCLCCPVLCSGARFLRQLAVAVTEGGGSSPLTCR